MVERLSGDARRVVNAAAAAAQRLGAEQIEPEHLLLGLADGDTTAGRALAEAGIDGAAIAAAIEADLGAMLELVGEPWAINPDLPLRRVARERGWRVRDYRTGRRAARIGLLGAAGAGVVVGGTGAAVAYARRSRRPAG